MENCKRTKEKSKMYWWMVPCCSSEPPPRATGHRWPLQQCTVTQLFWSRLKKRRKYFIKDQLNSINQLLRCCKYLFFSFLFFFFRKKFSSTCRECELYLFIDDFHGDEVMFLIEAAVVEQQTVGLSGCKSGEKKKEEAFFLLHLFEYKN